MEERKFVQNRWKIAQTCPCGKSNRDRKFVPFQGYDAAGHCHSCGKTFFPGNQDDVKPQQTIRPDVPTQYIPAEYVQRSAVSFQSNVFVQYLHTLFDKATVGSLVKMYHLGTTQSGTVIFWQIDQSGRVRTGKAMAYKPDGHRDQDKPPFFIHSKLNIPAEAIRQCLFGLHLVDKKPVALVESEKTAVVMAGRMPEFTWVACGGKENAARRAYDLRDRRVVAFPDADAFESWQEQLRPYGFRVSDAMQKHLTQEQIEKKIDLADVVVGDVHETTETSMHALVFEEFDGVGIPVGDKGYPVTWEEPEELRLLCSKHPNVAELIRRFELLPN